MKTLTLSAAIAKLQSLIDNGADPETPVLSYVPDPGDGLDYATSTGILAKVVMNYRTGNLNYDGPHETLDWILDWDDIDLPFPPAERARLRNAAIDAVII
jgi:hypothetical protein